MTFKESLVTGYITAPVKTEPTIDEKAAEILEACARDVRDGYWICGNYLDNVFACRPKGCAMGLLGYNGGELKQRAFHPDDPRLRWEIHTTADWNHDKWKPETELAMRYLARAIPGYKHYSWETNIKAVEEIIVAHNDKDPEDGGDYVLTTPDAIAWFERAAAAARAA